MEISALKGYRFDSSVVGDAGECIAPPYDIIDPEQQQELYEQHECNIVRIIKGKTTPDDSDSENVYTRARDPPGPWMRWFLTKGFFRYPD